LDVIVSYFLVDKNAKNADSLPKVLIENEVWATFVHRAFGGMSFSHKDSLLLAETLASRDLSLFVNVDKVHMAARILELYGTIEQREKYLPKIASGQCKPALCFLDDT
jgi:alkylation response protein AidB-like acyl-CoA dehydrogenase